jgi:hypothetical protein
MITLNVLTDAPLENSVFYLDTMTKPQILTAIQEAISSGSYAFGTAESINVIDSRDTDTLTTPREWLEARCIDWNKSDRRKFEMKISTLYTEKYNAQPRKAVRFGSETARWKKAVNVYDDQADKELFKQAFEYVQKQMARVKAKPTV